MPSLPKTTINSKPIKTHSNKSKGKTSATSQLSINGSELGLNPISPISIDHKLNNNQQRPKTISPLNTEIVNTLKQSPFYEQEKYDGMFLHVENEIEIKTEEPETVENQPPKAKKRPLNTNEPVNNTNSKPAKNEAVKRFKHQESSSNLNSTINEISSNPIKKTKSKTKFENENLKQQNDKNNNSNKILDLNNERSKVNAENAENQDSGSKSLKKKRKTDINIVEPSSQTHHQQQQQQQQQQQTMTTTQNIDFNPSNLSPSHFSSLITPPPSLPSNSVSSNNGYSSQSSSGRRSASPADTTEIKPDTTIINNRTVVKENGNLNS